MNKNSLSRSLLKISLVLNILVFIVSCSVDVAPDGSHNLNNCVIKGKVTYSNTEDNSSILVFLDKTDGLLNTPVNELQNQNSRSVVATKNCDEAGLYEFSNLETGLYRVYAVSSDFSEKAVSKIVVVNENETTTIPDLELSATGSLSGKITFDDSEASKAGVIVFIGGTSFMAATDSNGSFSITGIPANTNYQLIVKYDSYTYVWKSSISVVEFTNTYVGEFELSLKDKQPKDEVTRIVWKGAFESSDKLKNPQSLWAYYNTTDGCSYIYNGNEWELLASAGAVGKDGKNGQDAKVFIQYELSDGTLTDSAPRVHIQGTETLLVPPVRKGYTFKGYYFEKDFSGDVITILDADYPVGKVLYVKWALTEYTITYGGLTDAQNPNTINKYTIESDEITLTPATKPGYTFTGWNDGIQNINKIASGSTGNITLTATWQINTYPITYEDTKSANNPNQTSYTVLDAITLQPLEKTGYNFLGWYDENNNLIQTIPLGSIQNKTFYAHWQAIEYSIVYNGLADASNPNTVISYTIESDDITLAPATKTGYTFTGWNDGTHNLNTIAKGSSGNITLTATWQITSYNITYKNTKNADNSNQTSYTMLDAVALQPLEKTGYNFLGWLDELNNPIQTIPVGSTRNRTLTAKWEIINYTITYNYPSGASVSGNPSSYTVEDYVTFKKGTYNSQSFDWIINGTNQICTGWSAGTRIGNVTMSPVVNVEYIFPDISYAENNSNNYSSYSFYDNVVLYDAKSGTLEFKGWYLSSDFSGNPITGWNAQEMAGTIKLYAKYFWDVVDQIQSMTQDGTVNVTGSIGTAELLLINEAVSKKYCKISLDFSQAQDFTELPVGIFKNCWNLDAVILPDSVKLLGGIDENSCYDSNVFYDIRSITMPGVEVLGVACFQGCESLVEVVIPDTVKQIGQMCFNGCSSLETVIMGNGITEIPDFYWESSVAGVFACDELKTVKLSDNLKYIGSAAFKGCRSLKTITIPASVEELGCIYTDFYYNLLLMGGYPSQDYGHRIFPAFYETNLTSIVFENPNGWYVIQDWEPDSVPIAISAEDLSDPATAAELINNTYRDYKWKRSN